MEQGEGFGVGEFERLHPLFSISRSWGTGSARAVLVPEGIVEALCEPFMGDEEGVGKELEQVVESQEAGPDALEVVPITLCRFVRKEACQVYAGRIRLLQS